MDCTDLHTVMHHTPAIHQYTKSYTHFAKDMAIYGFCLFEKSLKIREIVSYSE